ncbi:MAG: C40 family peptidase [Bacteroidia bacterium]|nr:C40 family peptidase [Bacteroidia bacterium]
MIKGKHIFILLTFFVIFISQSTAQNKENQKFEADSLVNYAKSFLGTPYKWGGSSAGGFDCSGFVSFIFRHFQITTPHGARDYYKLGKSISQDSCKKGDIILFTGTNYSRKSVGHVGIIISDFGEPLKFIHSSSSKNHWGVTITDFSNSAYPKRFMGIRRL